MSANLDNPKSVPKTYWLMKNDFLSNKKIPSYHRSFRSGLVSDFKQKANI